MKHIFTLILIIVLTNLLIAQNWEQVDTIFVPTGVTVRSFSAPAFGDLDKDGDYDLVLGSLGEDAEYFENIGTAQLPKYKKDNSVLTSIYNVTYPTNGTYPVFVDLDADGDSDLVISGYNRMMTYINTGEDWVRDTLIFSTTVDPEIGSDAKPAFVDIDGDGDYDLFVGIGESLMGGPTAGITMAFRNTGTKFAPVYTLDNTLVTGIPDIGLNCYPAFVDIDNDKDFDLLLGRDLQTFVFYRNTGSSSTPIWTASSPTFGGIENSTYWKNPVFIDFDADGDKDLIYGSDGGKVFYYQNTGNVTTPTFTYNSAYFNVIKTGGGATVSLGDYDRDGDFDLLTGNWVGEFDYFQNNGSNKTPIFKAAVPPISFLNPGAYSCPVFVNFDNDTDLDIVSGVLNGKLIYYINNGGTFTQNTSLFSAINVNGFSAPTFADIDNDGDQDLFVGAEYTYDTRFYKNNNGVFEQDDTTMLGITLYNRMSPMFVDIDNDEDFDLFIGRSFGEVNYFENKGTKTKPVWAQADTLVTGIRVKQSAHLGFADMDADGRKDMIIGEYDGNFTYFKNLFATPVTSVNEEAPLPTEFTLYQNYPNPFNPSTVIRYSIPSASYINLTVYDILGKEVAVLFNGYQNAGAYETVFNASGMNLPSGIYFYRLNGNGFSLTKKLMLIK